MRGQYDRRHGPKNTAITRIPPTLCHGVARIFLTAPLSYDAVALHRSQCEKLLRYVKLATSSSLVQPHSIETYHVIDAKVVRRIRTLHVVIPAIVHPLPGHRE